MRILILHASAGAGHTRAAQALAAAFQQHDPGAEITVTDILDFTPRLFRGTYAKGYLRLVQMAPELWGYLYSLTDRKALIPWRRKVRSAFNAINAVTFRRFLKELNPDFAVCTHFMPLELLATKCRRISLAPVYGTVTDFAVHSLWLTNNVAGYFVANEDARQQLILRGEPPHHVHVTGIPIASEFSRSLGTVAARRALGLDPALPVVLVMSGGFGVGPASELIHAFRANPQPMQLLVVAGNNAKLVGKCRQIATGMTMPVQIHGYVRNIHDMIDAADLVVTKPGGLTASEVLAKGKPMVVVDPIPGQEQRNCEYVLEAGAASRLYDMQDAPRRLSLLLSNAQHMDRMRAAAQRLGLPFAARDIVRHIYKERALT